MINRITQTSLQHLEYFISSHLFHHQKGGGGHCHGEGRQSIIVGHNKSAI